MFVTLMVRRRSLRKTELCTLGRGTGTVRGLAVGRRHPPPPFFVVAQPSFRASLLTYSSRTCAYVYRVLAPAAEEPTVPFSCVPVTCPIFDVRPPSCGHPRVPRAVVCCSEPLCSRIAPCVMFSTICVYRPSGFIQLYIVICRPSVFYAVRPAVASPAHAPCHPRSRKQNVASEKKLSGQKACDEPMLDPIQLFKVDTFLVSLDVSLNSINQYFNDDVIAASSSTSDTEDEYEDDENLDEIFDFHKRRVLNPYNMDSMKTVFKTFQDSRLSGIFPTLNTSLLIALTLPVTSASTKRSFSKLKLVKTRLQTTLSQERLEDLIMISCEREQHEDILNNFAQQSTVLAKY
ncbi:hypothetical protein QTP88_013829 [Uroleucon formosanum]